MCLIPELVIVGIGIRMVLWFHLPGLIFVLLLSAVVNSAFAKFHKNVEENDIFYVPIPPEKVVIDLITFSVENILKIYEESQIEKNQEELLDHFEQIREQIEEVQNSIHNIFLEIEELRITAYSSHEVAIVESLDTYRDYVKQPGDKDLQKTFLLQAGTLRKNIRGLMHGLLGRYKIKGDIMVLMRNILAVRKH